MKTFVSGEILNAEDLNANFQEIKSKATPKIFKRTLSVNMKAGAEDYWTFDLTAGGFSTYPLCIPTVQTPTAAHITATPYQVSANSMSVRLHAHQAYNGTIAIYVYAMNQSDVINVS